MSSYDRIYAVVQQIPFGQVATYGQIATLANLPGQARLVGYALFRSSADRPALPWHRVINAQGKISESPFRDGDDHLQRSLLEQEGIEFDAAGKVSLARYRWQPAWIEPADRDQADQNPADRDQAGSRSVASEF